VQGSSTKEEFVKDVSARSVKTSCSSSISDMSREKLKDKIKQIQSANSNFDEGRKHVTSKTSKLMKEGCPIKVENLANKVRRPSGESVIVVDNMPASSQLANFRTSVIPTKKSSKKVEELERESQSARNSIVNAMQIKSRADLHKELNCVADLQEIEAEMHEDEENLKRKGRKNKSAALKAFHADQKAIHESIVNEVTRIGCSDLDGNKQFSKSLPIPVKKSKSSPEKRKVLQSKVLEDLLELEEEGNTEDEDEYGDVEVVNKVKVLKIADETEPEIRIRKVRSTKAKESYESIVTEKVKISRDGKELSKMEPQNVSQNRNISESKQDLGRPMNSPFISTVDNVPEITTVEDTPDSSIITTVEDETPDSSEVASIEDTAPDTVVAIDDDSPLVGFLERVEEPASSGRSSSSIEEPVMRKSKEQSDITAARKSTSEPESPTSKLKMAPDVDVVLIEKKSTSEPDPPQQIKTTPPVSTSSSSRGAVKNRLINRPNSESSARQISEPVPSIAFRKSNGVQYKSKEASPDTSVKSTQESLIEAVATSEPSTMVNVVVESTSGQTSPRSKGQMLKSTSEPRSPSPIEVTSPSKPHYPGNSNIKITGTKSTSEPRSPEVSTVKTNSESDSPIISSKRKSTPIFKVKKKNVKPSKIVVDSDSEDGGSSGSESSFQIPVEKRRTSQRPRREMKFRNLSEIDRAKLKNIPTVMREAILAGAKQTHEVKITKASDRNKLSRENPFYESLTASRGNRSTQQQRGRSAKNNSSLGSNTDNDTADQLLTDSLKREATKQIDLKENDKVATTSKRFRLNNHRKLSQNTSKPQNVETTANHLSQFANVRFVSDSGSDTAEEV